MKGSRPLIILLTLLGLAGVIHTLRVADNPDLATPSGESAKVVMVNGYPELHVDNKPFFMHSAAFYYYRVPRDRWEQSLHSLKQHGINTIDLYIIWNWHQPSEDTLDFTGRTNPGRDLAGLVKLISDMKFKLSIRPGPFICSEWRNGGYPDWLLNRSEYKMPVKDVLEGRYPRLSALQYEHSEEAAAGYLDNATHLRYTRKWYQDVMDLLRPYLASRGGNIILLQVDDDQGLDRYNYNGPKFWEYLGLLRKYLREAARDSSIPIYFNPADMRVTAASSAPPKEAAFWAMGQYYQEEGFGSDLLKAEDSINAKYLTEILKTQPDFPPYFIEYQAGWFSGAEDTRARATDPTNTLLSSRFLFQNGAKGLNYFPLQDTLFPEGYECPWSNYFYSWESAIGYEGDLRPRAEASIRNGNLLRQMGPILAASHYMADIGIVHSIGTYPQEKLTREDITGLVFRTMTATQFAQFNQVNAELVDLDYQSLQHLARYPMILMPVPSESIYKDQKVPNYLELSDRAQAVLIEYVRQGGTLVAYPTPPKGRYLGELFPISESSKINASEPAANVAIEGESAAAPGVIHTYPGVANDKRLRPYALLAASQAGSPAGYLRSFGKGSAIVLGAEFDRWVPLRSASSELDGALPAQPALAAEGQKSTGRILVALMKSARINRSVSSESPNSGLPTQQPYLSLLAANATADHGTGSAYGFLSVTNFDAGQQTLRPVVRDPRTGMDLELPTFEIAGRDALMLPLRLRLREKFLGLEDQEKLGPYEEIFYSTAEITGIRVAADALVLDLYHRGKASLRLRLNQTPPGAPSIGSTKLDYRYYPTDKFLDIDLPAPEQANGSQSLTIPYPGLKASPFLAAPSWHPPVDVGPSIRIPVRSDTAYALSPATRVAQTGETIEFSFVHPPDCKGKCKATVSAPDLLVSAVDPEKSPAFTLKAPYERTYIRTIQWSLENAGQTYQGTAHVTFLAPGSATAMERDVDRDGFSDYILENDRLRLIVYPHAGARSFALIRKDTNASAFTSIGGLRDLFRKQMGSPDENRLPAWTRQGIPGMFNRFYAGEITQESGDYAEIALSYDARDVAPTGAKLSRRVRLSGSSDFVEVSYTITPNNSEGFNIEDQAYINLNSIALGSMEDESATLLRSDRSGEMSPKKRTKGTIADAAWVALTGRGDAGFFGMSWIPGVFKNVHYDRRDYSVRLSLESQPWKSGEKSHTYRVRYHYGPDSPEARQRLVFQPMPK
jgi:hypothetical protein